MKPKFVIIAHSLCSTKESSYLYNIAVGEEVGKRGFEVVLVTNKLFSLGLDEGGVKIIPIFEVDWLGNLTISDFIPQWQKKFRGISKWIQSVSWEKLIQDLREKIRYKLLEIEISTPQGRLFLEKVKGSTFRLKNWLKKDLSLLQYIPFGNTLWGLAKIVIGLVRFILGIGTKLLIKLGSKLWSKLGVVKGKTFRESLEEVLSQVQISAEDHIFIPTIGIEQIEELLLWLETQDFTSLPKYHIVLTRDREDSFVTSTRGRSLQTCLQSFYDLKLWSNKVRFYTETEDLVIRYNNLSPVQFIKIPIPLKQRNLLLSQENRDKEKPIVMIYVGEGKKEQGYHLLPDIVADLWKDYIQPNKVKFIIQCRGDIDHSNRELKNVRLKLEQYPDDKVKLVNEGEDELSYYELLESADFVIIPYDSKTYRYCNLTLFAECLALGKPVVVPSNTWLAKQIDDTRGRVYQQESEIVDSIKEVIANLEQLRKSALEFSATWIKQQSIEEFVNCLLRDDNFADTQQTNELKIEVSEETPKILYILRGDDILNNTLNGQINLSHLQYLSQYNYQLFVIVYSLDRELRGDNFAKFVAQIQGVIKNYPLQQIWFIHGDDYIHYPPKLDQKKYLTQVYNNYQSVFRDWIEVNSLNLPSSLSKNLQAQNLDTIFIDNVTSWKLVEKLGLTDVPLICQMSDLYSYRYAMENNLDFESSDFELECEILAKCQVILAKDDNQLEKVSKFVDQPNFYLLPPAITLERETVFSENHQLKDYLWCAKNQEYERVINNALTITFKDKILTSQTTQPTKKIAILYPWGDILERKSGASQRTGLLIDYLISQNQQVWLFTTGNQPEILLPQVRYTFYQQDFKNLSLVHQVYVSSYETWIEPPLVKEEDDGLSSQRAGSSHYNNIINSNINTNNPPLSPLVREENQPPQPPRVRGEKDQVKIKEEIAKDWRLSMYYQFRFDQNFIAKIEQIVEWSDVVILEYPFWAKTVSKICKQKEVKIIITVHDVIYKQVKEDCLIGQILLREEISSLNSANQVICVSKEDQKIFSQNGVKSIVIPNPTVVEEDRKQELIQIPSETLKKYPWLEDNFCLFVGSKHYPNLEAVREIRTIATKYYYQDIQPQCRFIIVGGCSEIEEVGNFIALGRVESDLLEILYQQASLILSPMLSGTGTSVKIIEAMAHGKVILGTTLGFRGYEITSEENGIICDNLAEYPSIIQQLLTQPQKLEHMGKNALKLAQTYDYRQLYQGYLQIIHDLC